ncbi:brain mitochondrial carrier protein 1 isoform X1 [Leucoraja erinacea]|uniref:brain mitochondrial carrier protein 1 isoform X1 n=1 Tax=Leucoraja erinaceus TaxID=7782 RepID=UPI0024565219|nr:brain mitochondrial carrier protein 1 isoform X1 [Leucoraja erinacea]XP_055499384.1 brain mitochondrial carrier protein 1 isoform X1 [Leucoraja erinacea]
MMKCFERLVKAHITSSLPSTLDPYQFGYRPNRSTDDAIATALHLSLAHLETKNSYVRMLFIDFRSAFNTVIPQHLVNKLGEIGISTPLCTWLLDFLTDRPQTVRVGKNSSETTIMNTGVPQGCVLSPLLFTLMTRDCSAKHNSNHIIKFADDTTVVGLISHDDDSAYREEVQQLINWCDINNLQLNVNKTKEITVDFRKKHTTHTPLTINGSAVESVKSTKFLGVHITDDQTGSTNTISLVKKAQQRLHFLRRMRRADLPPSALTTFYRGAIESILTSSLSVWYGSCSAADQKALQRVVRTAEKITRSPQPAIQDLYPSRCRKRASNIIKDTTHPAHKLFTLLPSGKRYRSMRSKTTRFKNSFFPQAIRLLNTLKKIP